MQLLFGNDLFRLLHGFRQMPKILLRDVFNQEVIEVILFPLHHSHHLLKHSDLINYQQWAVVVVVVLLLPELVVLVVVVIRDCVVQVLVLLVLVIL